MGDHIVQALDDVSFTIAEGEFAAIMGPSGSGKSTLMNLLGCLDRPTTGEYRLGGELVSTFTPDALALVRNRSIGFVFQQFNLLARQTALENVELPLVYSAVPRAERQRIATMALDQVGLGRRAGHTPARLSGGEQQRVAIARALVNRPILLLADEPTGALDSRTQVEILALLQGLNRVGLTIVVVTHEYNVAEHAGRILAFRDGRLLKDERNAAPRVAHSERAA
ncbi:MAG: ABC transporter ATP-binding protein [Alphaproteobacteria bacterium]|nr:ABC transporter ATP-binding protein [Alphaproteobacteria bacterium]